MNAKNVFIVGKDGFSDIEEALAKSRELPKGIFKTIKIEGDYVPSNTIRLDERDNGLTVTGGRIIGGIVLESWEKDPRDSRFVRAKLPDNVNPQVFIVDSKLQKNAVYPKDSVLQCKNKPEDLRWTGSMGGGWNRPISDDEFLHMDVEVSDIPENFIQGSTKVKMYHIWDESTITVKEFDRESGKMTFASKPEHPAGAFERTQYKLINIRDGMYAPGSWYTDLSEGWLYYWPENDNIANLSGYVPALETMLSIKNAEDIVLSDMEFTLGNTVDVTSGLRSINLSGAVEIEDSRKITVKNLFIHDCAGHGVKVLKTKQHEVNGCVIENMGAGGIFTHECEDELICNNKINSIGLNAYSSIGIHAGGKSMLVWVQDGKFPEKGQTIIRSNKIENVPYCGITCNGGPHIVEYNTVIDSMSELEDGGAIYLSRANATVLRGNKLYGSYGGIMKKGVYYDEGGYACITERNEFHGMETPYSDHMCHAMKIMGNHFENDDILRLHFADSIGYEIENNVFVSNTDLHINVSLATFEKVVPTELVKEQLIVLHYKMRNNYFCTPTSDIVVNE